jgi:hypothetical protein
MKTLRLGILALVALVSGASSLLLILRTGWAGPGFPLIYLGLLIALTCVLRIVSLTRRPPPAG